MKLLDPKSDLFQPSTKLALYLANSSEFDVLLAKGGLAERLAKTPDDLAAARLAVMTVLSRPPQPEETDQIVAYLRQRTDRRAAACKQIVWSLLQSAEFRFNH